MKSSKQKKLLNWPQRNSRENKKEREIEFAEPWKQVVNKGTKMGEFRTKRMNQFAGNK